MGWKIIFNARNYYLMGVNMKNFIGMCVFLMFMAYAANAPCVDLNGKYVGADGVITITRGFTGNIFFVDIADKNEKCGMVLDMKFMKDRLVSDDAPVTLKFTKKGLILEMPRDELEDECKNFALDKPFKRQ